MGWLSLVGRCALCLAVVAPAGCYSYSYVSSQPAPGSRVALDLTDAGRVQLADHIGREVLRIEGWLVSSADSQYVLRVERTVGLWGNTVPWSGEQTSIPAEYVALQRVKKFSAPRTAVLAGGFTAGVIAFFAGRSLVGGSEGSGGAMPPGTGGGQ